MKALLIAAVAVAVSGAAIAKDLKGTVMTDVEMDKVTAAGATVILPDAPGGGVVVALPAQAPLTAANAGRDNANFRAGLHPAGHILGP
jgi:hypothetical protein